MRRSLETAEWSRTQYVRTITDAALLPVDVAILEAAEPPTYVQIAPEAWKMHRLGMSARLIARVLCVSHHTVVRAIEFWENCAAVKPKLSVPE